MTQVLDVGEVEEPRGERLADAARRLHRLFEDAWRSGDFDRLAALHAEDLRVESRRSIGRLDYVGIEEFRRQTWSLRELFPSASLEVVDVAPPGHVTSRIVFADGRGSEVAMVTVQELANGTILAVTTFDEHEVADALAYMTRNAEGPMP